MATRATGIAAFCESHGISRSTYYNLKALGGAPREMRVGRRVLISEEAAVEWRRLKESESATRPCSDKNNTGAPGGLSAELLGRILTHAHSMGLTPEQFLNCVLSSQHLSVFNER
jgi:hypothetical protein